MSCVFYNARLLLLAVPFPYFFINNDYMVLIKRGNFGPIKDNHYTKRNYVMKLKLQMRTRLEITLTTWSTIIRSVAYFPIIFFKQLNFVYRAISSNSV